MSSKDRDSEMDAYEHFLGDYACELTPHWILYTIARAGSGFALKDFGGREFGELAPSDGSLTGMLFGGPLRLSRENGSCRYILSGEAQPATPGAKRVPVAITLVKHVPPASMALERRFGVRAETLVRHVRQSEQWIHQIRSLHLAADVAWTRTPEGIAHRKNELKAQFPDRYFAREEERVYGLCPSEEGKEELHIEGTKFRHFGSGDRYESIGVCDGQTYATYSRHCDRENYTIASSPGDRGLCLLDGFSWPRMTQRHKLWWMDGASNDTDEGDRFGRAEEFVLVGKQDYRGVSCYMLECHPKCAGIRRWLVGVEDGLLRGRLTYEWQLRSEFWMDRYREVRPGWWFPMRQGYSMLGHDDALRPFLSGWRENTVTRIEIDEDFPDTLFQMEFKEGARVMDLRFGGPVTYEFKKDMTEQEWERIRAEGRKRGQQDTDGKTCLDATP
ncbi:MAG: hypothetical protein ACM3VT_09495 [Solirubrobacterales bacterium]